MTINNKEKEPFKLILSPQFSFLSLFLASERGAVFRRLDDFCKAESGTVLEDKDSSYLIKACTQPKKEGSEGSFGHMKKNLPILQAAVERVIPALALPRGSQDSEGDNRTGSWRGRSPGVGKIRPWQRCQCQASGGGC